MIMSDVKIFFAFPSTTYKTNLDVKNFSNIINDIPNLEFFGFKDSNHAASKTNILDDYLIEKKILTDKLNSVFAEYYDIKFKITTSWITSLKSGAKGVFHKHSHSWYSGVFYFQEQSSGLEFKNPIERDIEIFSQKINRQYDVFQPEKGDLIFFPSYLQHGVQGNPTMTTRHTLAFNIMPDGEAGWGDSKYAY